MYFSTGIYELGIHDNLIDQNLIVGKYLNFEMVFTWQKKYFYKLCSKGIYKKTN